MDASQLLSPNVTVRVVLPPEVVDGSLFWGGVLCGVLACVAVAVMSQWGRRG